MNGTDPTDLQNWLLELIDESRDREEELQPALDLSEPCQIEIFWLQDDVEGQVFVFTNDDDREDKEILVYGPFDGPEFVGEVGEVSRKERWQEPLPPSSMLAFLERQDTTKADALAGFIARFVQQIKNSVFSDFSFVNRQFHGGMQLWDGCFTQFTLGDIRENEIDGFFEDESDSEGSTESSQQDKSESGRSEEEVDETPAGGGHIYPPVWVEKPPEKTFEEKVWNTGEISYDVVLREDFLGDEIVVLRDGLILVLIQEGEKIREILNTVFSVGVLLDIEWRALQGRELVSARVDSNGMKSHQAELSTQRRELFSPKTESTTTPRGVIPTDGIRDILDLAEQIYPEEAIREKLVLHLHAHTHLMDFEYTASFILNWNIIEQQIIDVLNPHLRDEYDVNYGRRSSITDSRNWFISHLLEVAEITDAISSDEYSKLDDFRSKRNNIVHDMETASEEQAEELSELVSDFLEREIDNTLADTES